MKEMQRNSPTAVLMSHHWKPFSICLMLAALLQLSGYNVFIYYSVIIFDTIAPDIMHPYDPSILCVCIMLLSYIFVLTLSYRLKRRHLLLISMLGMTGLHFILGKFINTRIKNHTTKYEIDIKFYAAEFLIYPIFFNYRDLLVLQ